MLPIFTSLPVDISHSKSNAFAFCFFGAVKFTVYRKDLCKCFVLDLSELARVCLESWTATVFVCQEETRYKDVLYSPSHFLRQR